MAIAKIDLPGTKPFLPAIRLLHRATRRRTGLGLPRLFVDVRAAALRAHLPSEYEASGEVVSK